MSAFMQKRADLGKRRRFIGGSDARVIMGTDEAALLRLWREKRGEAEPEDLSGNLIVQLGIVTEELNRLWFERNTGKVVSAVQRRVEHPVIRFLAATLDGMVEGTGAVFESKFMLPWSFSEEAAGPHAGAGIRRPSPNLCRVSLPEPRLWRPEPLKRRNLHFLVPIDGCSTRAAIDEASGFANPGTSGQSGSEAPAQP
jgi:YqaJ-like viral recombinase domain